MKKILIITPYFAPAWSYGGPPKVLYNLAKGLTKSGFEVNVITTDALDKNRNNKSYEIIDNIKIFRLKNISNYLAFHHKLFYVLPLKNNILNIIQKSNFILFSDLRPLLHWQMIKFIKERKIPYGIFSFGQIPYDSGLKSVIKRIFDYVWVKRFVLNANFRFAQTPHEQEMFHKYFGINFSDTHLLPLPVGFTPKAYSTKDIQEKFHFKSSDFILLFVGRFNYLKGLDLLIKSAGPLIDKNKNIKLVLIGRDDGVEEQIRKIAKKFPQDNIIFPGPQYNEDVYKWYEIASCFIITPRYYEETSLAALEALSHGLNVITTKESDIPYLDEYSAGSITNNNQEEIQKSIINLYSKWKEDKRSIKANAIKLIKEKYSQDVISNKLIKYIETLPPK